MGKTINSDSKIEVIKDIQFEKEQKRYSTVLLDPPWPGRYGAERIYEIMTMEQIKNIPISDLVAENSHMWLWVPNNLMGQAIQLMTAWGFTYRNLFVWVKNRISWGSHLRNATEIALFGTRDKCPVKFRSQQNWMFAPVQDHSHKPEEMYDVIERVSPGDYLELFARRPRPGWDSWGNEIASDIVIPGYPVPVYSDKVTKKED